MCYPVPNPIYVFGSDIKDAKQNPDGSLTVYIQADSPWSLTQWLRRRFRPSLTQARSRGRVGPRRASPSCEAFFLLSKRLLAAGDGDDENLRDVVEEIGEALIVAPLVIDAWRKQLGHDVEDDEDSSP